MFETPGYGLDISTTELEKRLPDYPIQDVVKILVKSKLGREGKGRFSFIHRRFNEFFVVLDFLNNPGKIPMESISGNKRYRDALVLYTEIVDVKKAEEIVEYCLSYISRIVEYDTDWGTTEYSEAIHCLRFLGDGFKARKHNLEKYYQDIYNIINVLTERGGNLIVRKHAIEASVLLKQEDAEDVINRNFLLNIGGGVYNVYLIQAVLEASKYLDEFSKSLSSKFIMYYANVYFRQRPATPMRVRRTIKVLSMSNAFKPVRFFLKCYLIEQIILGLLIFIMFVFFAWLLIVALRENSVQKDYLKILVMPLLGLPLFLLQWLITKRVKSLLYWFFKNKIDVARVLMILIGGFLLLSYFLSLEKLGELVFIEWLPVWGGIAGLVMLIIIVMFLSEVINNVRYAKYNKKVLTTAKNRVHNGMKREVIEAYFYGLDGFYQERFISYIKKQQIVPTGNWTDGELPNVDDNNASGMLAELEEKWLELDR